MSSISGVTTWLDRLKGGEQDEPAPSSGKPISSAWSAALTT